MKNCQFHKVVLICLLSLNSYFFFIFDSSVAQASEDSSGWYFNFTPALTAEKGYDLGYGVDPELRYSLNLGVASLSGGVRAGGYYAKNLKGWVAMPTLRLTIPMESIEPYVAYGRGHGWLPDLHYNNTATMYRAGIIFHFSRRFSLGVEGTYQEIEKSNFKFTSWGSMISFKF